MDAHGHIKTPLTNIMNTAAAEGCRPLPDDEIWARLISNVLFMEAVTIPSTTILCNPATLKWLRNESQRSLLEWLIANERLIILRYTEDESFRSFAEALIERNSSALKWTTTHNIRRVAKELDTIFKDCGKIDTIELLPVDKSKTDISWTFIENIARVHPALTMLKKELTDEAKRRFDKGGVLHGTWWANLPQQNPAFERFSRSLQGVGAMVYDFAHAIKSTRLLIGHPYHHRSILEIGSLIEPFVTKRQTHIEPKLVRSSEVNAAVFRPDVLEKVDVAFLKFLEEGTETKAKRQKYFKALDDLYRETKEDHLKEVHARFDDYVNALGNYIEKGHLKEYFVRLPVLKRIKSSVSAWQCIDSVICSLQCSALVGAGGISGHFLSQGRILELFITILACGAIGGLRNLTKHRKDSLKSLLHEQEKIIQESRPFPLTLSVSMTDPVQST